MCEERISIIVRKQLMRCCPHPIISVSHYPIDLGKNIVVDMTSSVLSMFKQMVIALEASDADVIFHCEHDVIYNETHFGFTPERDDTYYFNTNVWTVNSKTGQALWYNDDSCKGRMMTSGLVAHRKLLLEHFKKKVALIEKEGFSQRKMGYRPGKKYIDDNRIEYFLSKYPNIDIKHGNNISKNRFKLNQFSCKEKIKDSFYLSKSIPYWGITEGRFDEFLRGIF